MSAPGPLEGRGAVVTGGGRGIGEAVARRLAEAGADVVVSARSEDEIREVVSRLREGEARATAIPCDVTNPEAVAELATRSARWFTGNGSAADILVNNAGSASSSPLEKLTLEEWNRLFAVNATGPFLCTRAFLPGMLERGWGRVVTVASVAALSGARYIAAYAASKHAALGLTRCVAAEVAARGVTANAICPGYVDTPMTTESVRRIARETGRSEEEALEAILSASPQARLIAPLEVAHSVLSLCVEESRGINGQAVVIDGGRLLA